MLRDIFHYLAINLDAVGRYILFNSIANQLRYPNNHTHYFSCVLLFLFAEASQEIIQEQVTRYVINNHGISHQYLMTIVYWLSA